jgi:hypothetical protein
MRFFRAGAQATVEFRYIRENATSNAPPMTSLKFSSPPQKGFGMTAFVTKVIKRYI